MKGGGWLEGVIGRGHGGWYGGQVQVSSLGGLITIDLKPESLVFLLAIGLIRMMTECMLIVVGGSLS